MGMTADLNDILISLSPNLKRFFSLVFSQLMRVPLNSGGSDTVKMMSDPITIIAQPVSTSPFPGQEFSIVSNSPQTQLRSSFNCLAFSSSEQLCSRRLRILSNTEPRSSKKHWYRGLFPGLQSQKYAPLPVFFGNCSFFFQD